MKIKKKVLATLHEVWMEGSLVKIKRDCFDDFGKGFVIDISAEWLLLQNLDCDRFLFDGYEAVRLRDISGVERDTSWIARAQKKMGLEPVLQPDVLLVDLPGILSSINAHYPVLGIEREEVDPEYLQIGRIRKLRKKSVTLREIGRQAQWHPEENRYRPADITRVTFDTAYMKHLLEYTRTQEAEAARELDNPDTF